MRNILTLATIFGLVAAPGFAASQQYSVDDPGTAITVMLDCAATSMALHHMHTQVEATLAALAAKPINPQLALMITSYKDMADADSVRVRSYLAAITDTLIPEIAPQSSITATQQKVGDLLDEVLSQLTSDVNDPTNSLDDQIAIARDLLARSDRCESLAKIVQQSHTNHP
jgi:hypothetical protein